MLRTVAVVLLLSLLAQAAHAACVCESAAGASIPCGLLAEGDRFVCGLADTNELRNKIVNLQLTAATAQAESIALAQKLKACTATKEACPPPPPPPEEHNIFLWAGASLGVGLVAGVLLTVLVVR